jgi:hypothetical protein
VSHFESESFESDSAPEVPRSGREGLPASYRMRADSHYVDHLTSDVPAVPLRQIPLSSIEEPEAVAAHELGALVDSIRAVGVVHPLLLVVSGGRYQILAGRRRFHAARAAGLTSVPGFVHHVEPSEAAALSVADNLHRGALPAATPAPLSDRTLDILRQVAKHMDGIAGAERLLEDPTHSIARRAALDIVRAHAIRCSWFVEAVNGISEGNAENEQRQTLGVLVDALAADFAAESRLAGVGLRVRVDDRVYALRVRKHPFRVGLLGAIFALLPFADTTAACYLTLTAGRSADGVAIDLAIRPGLMDVALGRSFFDAAWTTRPGGWPALLGALAIKGAAEREGGSVACEVESSGLRIRVTVPAQH